MALSDVTYQAKRVGRFAGAGLNSALAVRLASDWSGNYRPGAGAGVIRGVGGFNVGVGVLSAVSNLKDWNKPGNDNRFDDVLRLSGDALRIGGGSTAVMGKTAGSMVAATFATAAGWLLAFLGHEFDDTRKKK